jgi:DNA-binding LacI/PurR family transcriptional regulator
VEYLLDMGHRRIAFLHAPLVATNNRLRGYQIAHLHRQVAMDPTLDIEITTRDPDVGYQSLDRVLAAKPTAVFCEDDCLAVGLIAACRDRGIVVPRDLSVAGFGDLVLDMQMFPRIPLTTATIPVEVMGRLSLEQLTRQMDKPEDSLVVKVLVPTTFVPRQTTCPPMHRAY